MMELDVIYNQDCLAGMKNIPDKSIDLIVTDPPYLIANTGGGIYNENSDGFKSKDYVRELENFKDGFSEKVLDEICRVMKKINVYFFCSQKQIIPITLFILNKIKSVIGICFRGTNQTQFRRVGTSI